MPNEKAFWSFLEANKEGLKIMYAYDFVNNELPAGPYLISNGWTLIKLESSKPANTGIRDTDLVEDSKMGTGGKTVFELKKYSEYKTGGKKTYQNIEKA